MVDMGTGYAHVDGTVIRRASNQDISIERV